MSDERLREELDKALGELTEDDITYDHPIAITGEPMDPVLFVRYDALRAALATPETPTLDVERLARAIHRSTEHPHVPGCLDMDRDTAGLLAAEYARLTQSPS